MYSLVCVPSLYIYIIYTLTEIVSQSTVINNFVSVVTVEIWVL